MKFAVMFYDVCDDWIETKEFMADSTEELGKKATEHAKILSDEGWIIAGWKTRHIKEDF